MNCLAGVEPDRVLGVSGPCFGIAVGARVLGAAAELLALDGWLAHEVQGVDAERFGETADDIQAQRLEVLAALNARGVDTRPVRELLLEQRAGGAPVVQRRCSRCRRASSHRPAGIVPGRAVSALIGMWTTATAPV